MAPLKLKLKLNGLEFELEGEEQTVKEEFAKFQAFVTDDILVRTSTPMPHVLRAPVSTTTTDNHSTSINNQEFPVLAEIVKKDLPKTESDWVLIYGFYASGFGVSTFTKKDIKDLYESTRRLNESRLKNLDNSFKSLFNKGYIKMQNDDEFFLLDDGREHVKTILSGQGNTSPSKQSKKGTASKKNNTKTSSSTKKVGFVNLDLSKEKLKSLREFFEIKNPQGQKEEVLVVIKWFKDNMGKDDISTEEVSYLMSVCSTIPNVLHQVLVNIKGNGFRWITKTDEGKFKLTSVGELYVEDSLSKTIK